MQLHFWSIPVRKTDPVQIRYGQLGYEQLYDR